MWCATQDRYGPDGLGSRTVGPVRPSIFFGRSLRRDISLTHFQSVWFGRFPIFGVFRLAHGLVKSQSGQVQGLVQSLFGLTQSLQFVQSGPEPWVCSSGLEFSKSVWFGSESSHESVRSDPELSLSARSGAESTKSVRFGPEISKSVRSGPGLAKSDWSGPYGLLDLDLLSATHDCLTLSPIALIRTKKPSWQQMPTPSGRQKFITS